MILKKVQIKKYKSFEEEQSFDLEDDVTILVGMNESGKTAALETIAKTNYFENDLSFHFDTTHDYPRKQKKRMDKSGVVPEAVTCVYEVSEEIIQDIENELGEGVVSSKLLSIVTKYNNKSSWNSLELNKAQIIENKTKELGISSKILNEKLKNVQNLEELQRVKEEYKDEKLIEALSTFEPYFRNEWEWANDALGEYVARKYLKPNRPKFLYYDEYFSLPSRISIENLQQGNLKASELKTAKALFELADINTAEILKADDFEDFIAELEATEAIISEELFKYWQTNKNLQITFQIDKKEQTDSRNNTRVVEHILDVRVKNKGVSLPLRNRSKGFNWFFSFLVWFKKIQEDVNSSYVLLLDEPGLNLHASAQHDLLRFIEDLSERYQVVYTTHSPFMISSDKLNRVRTVLETDNGSKISDSVQEKDPDTLFPLQAALGYDIAQNLFISSKNLLVEGVSDLTMLTAMSGVLEAESRIHLRPDITIVPTGGLEKVGTFISLLRGSKLEIACLLDSYTDPKGKEKMEEMVKGKIIHRNKIRFFDEFVDGNKADLEDLFTKEDYLKLFNSAFPEHSDVSLSELNPNIPKVITQLNKHLDIDRFNHYRPASELVKVGINKSFFDAKTLDNFEKVFEEVNRLFD